MLRHCNSDFGHDQDCLVWYEKAINDDLTLLYIFSLTMMMFDGEGFLTVIDGMVACGMDHDALFQDETQAQRLATDIFGNQFSACLDVMFKELDKHFKTYTDLTAAQGRIQILPGVRKNIKAFVQWTRDECVLVVILPLRHFL